jgi:hypothetical protein
VDALPVDRTRGRGALCVTRRLRATSPRQRSHRRAREGQSGRYGRCDSTRPDQRHDRVIVWPRVHIGLPRLHGEDGENAEVAGRRLSFGTCRRQRTPRARGAILSRMTDRSDPTIRFAVGTPDGHQSVIWRLWVHGSDVYLMPRPARHWKVSLHQSGKCHWGFETQTHLVEVPALGQLRNSRVRGGQQVASKAPTLGR